MNQEYTEDKRVKLKKISSGRRLLEAVLLVIAICAVYLMVVLISFNPSDPSWSQTSWHEPVHNWGGSVGAWLSDTLFSAFGILAYAVPPFMLLGCWNAFRQKDRQEYIDFFTLALRVIGALALILTSCGLAALNIDDLNDFAAGGVIGNLFGNAILPWFNILGATLALLGMWGVGFTLFTGWSWLTIAEKIGAVILDSLSFVVNRGRNNAEYDENDLENTLASERSASEQKHAEQADKHEMVISTETLDEDDVLLTAPTLAELADTDSALQPASTSPALDQLQEQEPVHYSFELPDDDQSDTNPQSDDFSQAISNLSTNSSAGTNTHLQDDNVTDTFTLPAKDNVNLKDAATDIATSAVVTKNPQIKQGIGPEMPRPNPVRIPTRRELYGIKVPSHRLAEHMQRKEKERQNEQVAEANEQRMDAQQQDMLRQQFLKQQRERYGADFEEGNRESESREASTLIHKQPVVADEPTKNSVDKQTIDEQIVNEQPIIDEQKAQEEALRIAFEQQQRERYQLNQPEPAEFVFMPTEPLNQQVQEKNIATPLDSHESRDQHIF
ncbi:DNA translocase FtsK 4TM domain-containing protein, partial [Xenorhabdus griffiniae]|uniref:DNA translocase FtsK 4TM domain-containing protein n=1 Tax=Xenorhabdus griffiniae TaxID=351672 RepID=UPI002359C302